MSHKRQLHSSEICVSRKDRRLERNLYDNGFNESNHVPPQHVLRSKLNDAFPILHLPEYIKRRIDDQSLCLVEEHKEFDEMLDVYRSYIDSSKSKKKNKSKMKMTSDTSTNIISCEILEYLVRIIVVPISIDLIEKVNRRRINDITKRSSTTVCKPSVHDTHATATNQVTSNPYLLPKVPTPYIQKRQSLESIVDGAISSLVRNGKRLGRSIKMTTERGSCPIKYRNLLCEGHRLGSDGFIHHSGTLQRVIPVAHSQTLGHGIQVTHPNACASYARTDPVMRRIHSLIGDDLLRELLMNAILLIPIGDTEMKFSSTDHGNYFQLCGPPLDHFSKSITPEDLSTRRTVGKKRKRNEEDLSSRTILDGKDKEEKEVPYEQTLLIDSDWVIPRYRMLYSDSFVKSVGLPPRHVLNQNMDNQPFLLLQRMLPIKSLEEGTKGVCKRWKVIKTEGLKLCSKIIHNHKKCDYHRLLDRSCPLPCANNASIEELVSLSTSKQSVASFLISVIKRVFPLECWGSCDNFEVIAKIVRLFVHLRRKEDMSMNQLMKDIKITEIKWLNPERRKHTIDHVMANSIMQHFLKWLYVEFIMPLIRCTFYATDTQFTGDEVNYYRKPIWSKIRTLSIEQLTKEQFNKIYPSALINTDQNDQLGHSQLRILPKNKGFRPIALLCRKAAHAGVPSSLWADQKKSVNRVLKPCFDVLTNECKQNPDLYGFGVAGVSELHERLSPFVAALKKFPTKDLYFISLDILKCFDNINQEHLLSLIDKILYRDDYIIQEHTILTSNLDKAGVLYDKQKCIGAPTDAMNAIMTASKNLENKRGSILIEHSACSITSKVQLFELITQHVKNNTLVVKEKFGPLFLHQTKGIPQGSILSTMFCNVYYGDIEKDLVNGIHLEDKGLENGHLIVRVVDDFMLVTTDYDKAAYFRQHLEKGNPALGVRINTSKTKTSHKMQNGKISPNDDSLVTILGKHYFSWCGYLFNISTMEVHIDYSRFEGKAANESIRRFEKSRKEGAKFISRLQSFLAPRCQPILFDPNINSWEVLCINFYQTVAFAAVKCVLYFQSGGLESGIDSNIDFISNTFAESLENTFEIISQRLNHAQGKLSKSQKIGSDSIRVKWLERSDAIWIGYLSLLDIFTNHSKYWDLISLLRRNQQSVSVKNIGILKVGTTIAREMFNSNRFDFSNT